MKLFKITLSILIAISTIVFANTTILMSKEIATVTEYSFSNPLKVEKVEKENKCVILIGVDGAGNHFSDTSTPNIDRIFANGATTNYSISELPAVSGPNWMTMLSGVRVQWPDVTNKLLKTTRNKGTVTKTVFKATREKYPDAKIASIVNWEALNYGLVEQGLGVYMKNNHYDKNVYKYVMDYLDKNCPTFLFVHFCDVDYAGEDYGFESSQYFKAIRRIDGYIGKIYDKVQNLYGDSTEILFIVTADNGGYGPCHGTWVNYDLEKNNFLGLNGPVNKINIGKQRINVVAGIIADYLDLKLSKYANPKKINNLFKIKEEEQIVTLTDYIDAMLEGKVINDLTHSSSIQYSAFNGCVSKISSDIENLVKANIFDSQYCEWSLTYIRNKYVSNMINIYLISDRESIIQNLENIDKCFIKEKIQQKQQKNNKTEEKNEKKAEEQLEKKKTSSVKTNKNQKKNEKKKDIDKQPKKKTSKPKLSTNQTKKTKQKEDIKKPVNFFAIEE